MPNTFFLKFLRPNAAEFHAARDRRRSERTYVAKLQVDVSFKGLSSSPSFPKKTLEIVCPFLAMLSQYVFSSFVFPPFLF